MPCLSHAVYRSQDPPLWQLPQCLPRMRQRPVEEPDCSRTHHQLSCVSSNVLLGQRRRATAAEPCAEEHGGEARSCAEGEAGEEDLHQEEVQVRRVREEAGCDGVRHLCRQVLRGLPGDLPSQGAGRVQGACSNAHGACEQQRVRHARGPGALLLLHSVRGDGLCALPPHGGAHRAPAHQLAHGGAGSQDAAARGHGAAQGQTERGAGVYPACRLLDPRAGAELQADARPSQARMLRAPGPSREAGDQAELRHRLA
mmetsp:Transcript_10210/g.23300  ORF Transcript_10210/g.23300 Transcript_10210/m.23300 type:complete len:256 (-) Transcript_10210:1176-1943(-)